MTYPSNASPVSRTTQTTQLCRVATLAMCLLPASVLADNTNGYGVATAARARNAYDQAAFVSAYRMTADSSTNYTRPGDTPSTLIDTGCLGLDPAVMCSGGAAGTGGTDFNLTASTSSANRSSMIFPGGIGTGVASARANLATGELGVVATSDKYGEFSGFPTYNGAQGTAYMNDTLTFNVAGAEASTVTHIHVDFILNGDWSRTDGRGGANVYTSMNFGGAHATFFAGSAYAPGGTTQDGGWVDASWSVNPSGSFRFEGVYALTGASSTFGFNDFLYADAGGGAAANYGSTSHFLLTLPDNVSFTSASGVFLSPVPEPGTVALMLAGLGVVGFTARRRQG